MIIDMRKNVSDGEINDRVAKLGSDSINRFLTKITFKHMLRKRAYAKKDFTRLLAETPFCGGEIVEAPFGLEVWLTK